MKLNYISNLSLKENSGGGSAVNYAVYNYIKNSFETTYFGEINPGLDKLAKFKSNALRALKIKGNYHFFSNKRLQEIKSNLEVKIAASSGTPCFFHGFTPWIKYQPQGKYFAFNDACFATYVDIYNNKQEFSDRDLQRVYKQEAQWLDNATIVFFRSKWALEETKKHYKLAGNNFKVVGLGGFIDLPEKDIYAEKDGKKFLFISREFVPKGGLVVVEAFQKLKKKHPEIELNIIGEKPPEKILQIEGINYLGFLRKNMDSEKQLLIDTFAHSFALIHPTVKDTNSLVLTELGYYGVPAITSKLFAFPEYVLDSVTGFLIKDPRSVEELSEKMETLISDDNLYQSMRKETFQFSRKNTWEKVGQRLVEEIEKHV